MSFVPDRVKIEITKDSGKITLTLEGETMKQVGSIVQNLEEIIGINSRSVSSNNVQNDEILVSDLSKIDQIRHIIHNSIRFGWFNSKDIQELYAYQIGNNISLSTVSTYLSRLVNNSVLEKRGSRSQLEYRLSPSQINLLSEF